MQRKRVKFFVNGYSPVGYQMKDLTYYFSEQLLILTLAVSGSLFSEITTPKNLENMETSRNVPSILISAPIILLLYFRNLLETPQIYPRNILILSP